MNRFRKVPVLTLVVAALSVAAAAPTHADLLNWKRPVNMPAPRPASFAFSGNYGGTLNGQLLVGTESLPMASSFTVYQLGVGAIALGDVPIGSRVFVSGVVTSGSNVVQAIIVRPANELEVKDDDTAEQHVHVLTNRVDKAPR